MAIDELFDGYRRFRGGPYQDLRRQYDALAHQGQSPRTVLIGCVDSRADPGRVFDAAPGEMLVVRNVANLVPPFEQGGGLHGVSAAIEFAVTQLKVENVVVFGHGRCGGINAALTGAFDGAEVGHGHFIAGWMAMIAPARDQVREAMRVSPDVDGQRALEHAAIRLSLANLRSFPFVAEAEAAGTLALHGTWFDIAEGTLQHLDPDTGRFQPVPAPY